MQFLIACSMDGGKACTYCKQSKTGTVGRPGNEATLSHGYMIGMYVLGYSVDAQLELLASWI